MRRSELSEASGCARPIETWKHPDSDQDRQEPEDSEVAAAARRSKLAPIRHHVGLEMKIARQPVADLAT